MPRPLTLQWENSTDADGDPVAYKLYIGTDPTFAGVNPMTIASVPKNNNFSTAFRYSMGIIGLFGVIAMGGVSRNRKKISLLMIPVILLAGFVLTSCGSSEVGNNKSSNNNNKNYESYTVNLKPNTTYYWKVAVDDGKGGVTESDTYSFTTGHKRERGESPTIYPTNFRYVSLLINSILLSGYASKNGFGGRILSFFNLNSKAKSLLLTSSM